MDSAKPENVEIVKNNIKNRNPNAKIIEADSPVTVDKPEIIENKNVLVVEDGPTLTHGGMEYGAGFIAAQKFNSKIIEPRKYAVGSIKKTYEKYGHLEKILPAMGYGKKQISDLEETINNAECDAVVIGTPIDLGKIIKINKPSVRVKYELEERGKPDLEDALKEFLKK